MSSFVCPECGAYILDSPTGYTTECPHYPLNTIWSEMELDAARGEAKRLLRDVWKEREE